MSENTMDDQLPSDGEKNARRGYWRQDDFSAKRIYNLLLNKDLRWVGLADSEAGIFDDIVVGTSEEIVAHQVKSSVKPEGVGIKALMLGKKVEVKRLAQSFAKLRAQFPTEKIRLLYVTDDFAATQDTLIPGEPGTSTAAFFEEKETNRNRGLAEWKKGKWRPLVQELVAASELDEPTFQDFFSSITYVMGGAVDRLFAPTEDELAKVQIDDLAKSISKLVVQGGAKDRWSRSELLAALGWPDREKLRFIHQFPMGSFVQKNEVSEPELVDAIAGSTSGYISLVGPPGSGKSTLLQRVLRNRPGLHVLRYLAFVPGTAQGQGRGEADYFYDDLNAQFSAVLSGSTRLFETGRTERQRSFEAALLRAGKEYQDNGRRFLIVIDGLDHIPREEMPDKSLLTALPLPESIPDGITFVLGTQSVDLKDIPRSVRHQVMQSERNVQIKPLTVGATKRIADQLGLSADIDRRRIHDVAQGHPLVTRYLVELILGHLGDADTILDRDFTFDGDLENLYETAWHGIETAENAVDIKRVLLLIAHAQGVVAPEFLASGTSDDAVESVLDHAGHLLKTTPDGWEVFHNSFRIFLRSKNVQRFGKPDASFQSPKVYVSLAKMVEMANPSNEQRWLGFRYLYLAGEGRSALKTATREYFLDQYLEGRAPFDVQGDISDAYRLIEEDPDPTKLYELLLTDDEIARRSEVFEGVDSLIDGYVSTDLVEIALEELELAHPVGKEWLVVDKLLEQGNVSRSRMLFESTDLFGNVDSPNDIRPALEWARRAVHFYDENMLREALDDHMEDIREANYRSMDEAEASELEQDLQFCVARAAVEKTAYDSVASIAAMWGVDGEDQAYLYIQDASNALVQGDLRRAVQSLKTALEDLEAGDLHGSWLRFASQTAIRCQNPSLAKSYAELIKLEALGSDKYIMTETVAPECRELVSNLALLRALGLSAPELPVPEGRLLKGAQHHLVQIGSLIGETMRGPKDIEGDVARVSREAVRFIATARKTDNDDWGVSYWMPKVAEEFALALTDLHIRAECGSEKIAALFDDLLSKEQTIFRWWPGFRRQMIRGIYENGGSREVAAKRLEATLADLNCSDPQEELQEKAACAITFAQIGEIDRARSLLLGLREEALGSYRPAKKDGDYDMWVSVLSLANAQDPKGRSARSAVAMRLVDGLQKTTGYDKASRISRQVLFEASSTDAGISWNAVVWAASTGAFSWFGIIDSCLRGVVKRDPKQAKIAALLWSKLALPWFNDGWSSTTETGVFLAELFSYADEAEIDELETDLVASISYGAPENLKLELLRIIGETCVKRGKKGNARAEQIRWETELSVDHSEDPERRNYGHLLTFDDLSASIEDEKQYNATKGETWRLEHMVYGLRNAVTRIVRASDWEPVAKFVKRHPKITSDWNIAFAVAELAVSSGKRQIAKEILHPFIEDQDAGWSWPSSRGRFRHHQVQHLLGTQDAHKDALVDFVQSIASSGYGVSTTMWSIDEIFPLVFDEIRWDQIWTVLERNIRSSRDFKAGEDVPNLGTVQDDADLIANLLRWSFSVGATATALQATETALELLEQGEEIIFEKLVRLLLNGSGEEQMRAASLLSQSWMNSTVSDSFKNDVESLSRNNDLGIAATATFLCERWGVARAPENRELPAFYSLELAIDERAHGKPLVNKHSQALLLDDPFAWTQNYSRIVDCLAGFTGITKLKIRYRVAGLISSWGGIDKFGHEASKQREASLSNIDLKLMYRRLHAEAALRALRNVAGELWHSGLLKSEHLPFMLHELHCDPDRVRLPAVAARPPGLIWPPFPKNSWGDDREHWLKEVASDLQNNSVAGNLSIGEYRRWVGKESRNILHSEQWFGDRIKLNETSSLERSLYQLGRVIRIGEIIPLDAETPEGSWPVSRFLPHRLDMEPLGLLVLSPLLARQMSWVCSEEDPTIYYDSNGDWVARTVLWQEGFACPADQEGKYAEGQRVVLSDIGATAYQQRFGQIETHANAWRRVEVPQDSDKSASNYATKPG
jgi:hypothetical protein